MNINEVRILEACHKFLIDLTSFKDDLENDKLVFRHNGNNIKFDTYQKYEKLSFVDYQLKQGYLDDVTSYFDDREMLIDLFPTEEHLRKLSSLDDKSQVRLQIFKLLAQVNLGKVPQDYYQIKKDNFGYNFYNFTTKETYPIILFKESDTFELITID